MKIKTNKLYVLEYNSKIIISENIKKCNDIKDYMIELNINR